MDISMDIHIHGNSGHNSVSDRPLRMKFVTSVQNYMPMTIESSKLKPEVEFPANINVKNCHFVTTCKAHH